MMYTFKCEVCGLVMEKDIPMSDYDKEKDKQICTCSGNMKRVLEWQGSCSLCNGMYGIDGKKGWNTK